MSTQERHLAAILFTDIVGYTTMMQKDELKAVHVINHYHRVLEKSVATHRGEILNNYGDGSLCSFSSVLEALNCAIELQRNLQLEPVVPLRIGLHVGEIFFENGKVLGDGLNVASRIQSLGTSNSILFSSEIHNKVKNQPEFKTLSLGSFHFKNVEDRIEVFALSNDGFTVPDRKKMEGKLESPVQKKIVVLPFENMSNEPDQEYFSDGLTEEIIADLCKLSSLHVISRTSAMVFKGSKKDVRTIGQELNVRYVLEGSVRKSGNKLRITAQLIDAPNDAHLWAEKFNGTLDDVFDIQEKVSHAIVDSLKLELTPQERAQLIEKSPVDPEAHELYLGGRYHINGVTHSELTIAIQHFEDAIRKEPNYALAYAGLACAYNYLGWFGGVAREVFPKSKQAAIRALEIDETLAEAHSVLGYAATFYDWDWAAAEREIERAIALNPNYAEGYLHYSWYLGSQLRFEEGRAAIVKAGELDPLSLVIQANMSNYYQWKRDYDGDESYVKLELDITAVGATPDGKAKFNVYRAGYSPKDIPATPLATLEIVPDLINGTNKHKEHNIEIISKFGKIAITVDGNSAFDGKAKPLTTGPFGRDTGGIMVNLNPVGDGGDYVTFGMLADIGFAADARTESKLLQRQRVFLTQPFQYVVQGRSFSVRIRRSFCRKSRP